MKNALFSNWLSGCEYLTRAWASMLRKQYEWLGTQRQLGMRVWNAMMPSGATAVRRGLERTPQHGAQTAGEPDDLENLAMERLHKGLAPPREIYDIRNRGRIDWARVPEWAQPADPESFEGCTHEG
jgi:hypothetical protein